MVCRLVRLESGHEVAEIKYPYIQNITEQAAACRNISRIVLFGSSTGERCREDSDIDIAVFGSLGKNRYLKSAEFRDFQRRLFAFDPVQDYDILYFPEDCCDQSRIMQDIGKGAEIYRRAAQ